jgi:ABC-type phosphate transport system permease subunit
MKEANIVIGFSLGLLTAVLLTEYLKSKQTTTKS